VDGRSKTHFQTSQAICTYVLPASKTLVNQKNISSQHPTPPPSENEQRLENEQRKSYRILISSCWTIDIQLFDFYRKRGLGADQSHYNRSRRWSWLHTTLAQITRIAPKWITLYWKFFHSSRFLSNLRLPWKNQSCLEIFHCIEYTFYIQECWETCFYPEKQRGPWIQSTEYIFYYSGIWATCACPEKQSCPGIFHCIDIFFII